MKALQAFKNNNGTVLINDENLIVSFYPDHVVQPHRNSKKITHNCFNYSLEWIKPATKKAKHWYNQMMLARVQGLHKTFFNSKQPISKELQKEMEEDTKNIPLKIEFINNYQFSVKLLTK